MRTFRSAVLTCAVCGRPIYTNREIPDPYVHDASGIRHAIRCVNPAADRLSDELLARAEERA